MLNCSWEKKYAAELEQEERAAKAWNLPGKNWAEDAVQRIRAKQHCLYLDHRMGGCICQHAPAGTFR